MIRDRLPVRSIGYAWVGWVGMPRLCRTGGLNACDTPLHAGG